MDTRELIGWIKKTSGGKSKLLSQVMYRPDLASVLPGDIGALSTRQREILESSTRSFLGRDYLLSPDPEAEPYVADILAKIDQRMANAESGIRPKPCMMIGPAGLGKSTLVDTVIRSTHEVTQGRLRVYELSSTQLLDDPLYSPLNTKNFCALIRDWYEQPDMLSPQSMDYLRGQAEIGAGSRGDSLMALTGPEYNELVKLLGAHDDIPGLPNFQGDPKSPADWSDFSRRVTGFSVQGFRQLSPLGAELLNPRPAYYTIVKIEEFLQLTPQQQDCALGLISAAGSSAETATNAVPFAEKDFLSGYQRRKAMGRQYNPCMAVYVTSNPDESMTGRIGTRMDYISIPPNYSVSAFKQILARQMPLFLREKGSIKAGAKPIPLADAESEPDRYYFKSNVARLSEKNLDGLIDGVHQFAGHILTVVGSKSAELNQFSNPGRFIPAVRESLEALPNSNNIFARPCIDWFISLNQRIFRPTITTPDRIGEELLRSCVGDDALNTPEARKFWSDTFNTALGDTGRNFREILAENLSILTESETVIGLPTGDAPAEKMAATPDENTRHEFVRRQLVASKSDLSVTGSLADAIPEETQLNYAGLVPLARKDNGDRNFLLIHPEERINSGKADQFGTRPMEFHLQSPASICPEDRASVVRACARIATRQITENMPDFKSPRAKKQHIYVPRDIDAATGEMSYVKITAEKLIEEKKRLGNLEAVLDIILAPNSNYSLGQPSERDAMMEKEGDRAPVYPMRINPVAPVTAETPQVQPVR
jgi:hypothetical protein